ncbi:MAG TPA: EF-P lysine aminoacylase EpmA [Syntrophales bacterium]|nr:EF-P lysine aminoacylase EpmA [Syntrophales bacterium]
MSRDEPVAGGEWRLTRRRAALEVRARMLQALRLFFVSAGYLEVETPARIPAPAPEAHIDAPPSGDWFLQTSPELCMKRLLAAGYGRIFQIAKCYRDGERGDRHLPEFTMLEWYRQAGDYRDLMADCEALLPFVLEALGREAALVYRGERIDLAAPWERLSVAEAFRRFTRLSPEEALWNGCFDERMALDIEPRLGRGRPTFLYDYPAACASLARRKDADPGLAERFELYIAGLEMANGFSELTDVAEQRDRFAQARAERERLGKADYPTAGPFLAALGAMPPAAGIALGVDRLAMLLADADSIDGVVAFVPEDL